MPILSPEPELYPGNLFEALEFETDETKRWHVIHTRPRSEKNLARRLYQAGIWYHLPVQQHHYRTPKGRKCVSYLPLFPSYLFLYGDAEQRGHALTTNCIVRMLDVPDCAQLTFDLRQVHKAIESGATLRPEAKLQPGAQVRVTSGPFVNFEGRILKRHSGDVLLVVVHYLQQGITLSLEGCQVEPV